MVRSTDRRSRRIDVSELWLEKFFRWLHSNLNISWPANLFDWLYWLAVAALFALLAYLSYRFWKAASGAGRPARKAARGTKRMPKPHKRGGRRPCSLPSPGSRSDLLAEARRNYNEGRYNEAIIYLSATNWWSSDKHRLSA